MTEGRQKEKRAAGPPRQSELGFYVYCIAETVAATQIFADPLPSAIEDEAVLELVKVNDLAAVTSCVPLAMYGQEELAEQLTNATWTATRAMRHEQVVEHFARQASVVPLRFGTIYLERTGIERMLAERHKELNEIIGRFSLM